MGGPGDEIKVQRCAHCGKWRGPIDVRCRREYCAAVHVGRGVVLCSKDCDREHERAVHTPIVVAVRHTEISRVSDSLIAGIDGMSAALRELHSAGLITPAMLMDWPTPNKWVM